MKMSLQKTDLSLVEKIKFFFKNFNSSKSLFKKNDILIQESDKIMNQIKKIKEESDALSFSLSKIREEYKAPPCSKIEEMNSLIRLIQNKNYLMKVLLNRIKNINEQIQFNNFVLRSRL